MFFISLKLAFITVPISLYKSPVPMHFVIFELTFINRTVNNNIPSNPFDIFLIRCQLATEVWKFNALAEFQGKVNLIWIQGSFQKSCEI